MRKMVMVAALLCTACATSWAATKEAFPAKKISAGKGPQHSEAGRRG
jgi:hypothetical protein